MKGCDYLLSQYVFIDKERLAAAGASYGGYMINWLEGHTDRFRCLISHAGVFDLRSMYGATEELCFPDEDHFIRKPQNAELWWKAVHEWLAEYLK